MRRFQQISFFLLFVLLLSACESAPEASPTPTSSTPAQPSLLYLRSDSPEGQMQLFIRQGLDDPGHSVPLHVSSTCAIWGLYPAPFGQVVAMELDCGNGMTVMILDLDQETTSLPAAQYETDARFLAWTPDGEQAYLRIDTLGDPRVILVDVRGERYQEPSFPASLYDLAVMPGGQSVLYATTQGLGFGSELWMAGPDGRSGQRLLAEPNHIIAYARPSPQGDRIAYILMPDSQVPFVVGQLWVMAADGSEARFLADVDAGHGYAPVWSPDGRRIAVVVRENPDDPDANTSAWALVSNIWVVDVESGDEIAATNFPNALVEVPVWSPDGQALVFNVIGNGTITVWISNLAEGTLQPLDESSFSCCAVYLADE
jgi:dipeptidyl aminopeptidase/acylaminoacyl peptidase